LRFVGDGSTGGDATITYKAWDLSGSFPDSTDADTTGATNYAGASNTLFAVIGDIATLTVIPPPPVDTDEDGVPDADDVDDDNDGILDLDEATEFSLLPSGNVTRVGNVWTYAGVTTVNGVVYDLQVEQVAKKGSNGYSLSNNTSININNWNPRQGHYVILEYTLIDQATGQPQVIDAFKFVTGDIDGQSFGSPAGPNRAWEIIGFESAEVDSISFNTGRLGYRGFLNGHSAPAGYSTIRQGTPSNISGTGNDIAVQYTDTSSFRVMYGVTGGSSNANSADRNFFFRNFEGLVLLRDTDGDGIHDHLDLDSDNDGITDNVEAQSTAGYVAPNEETTNPSGYEVNADGLNTAYTTAGGYAADGVTPVDTDGDSTADYLDLDSDNDGFSDADEAGHGQGQQTGVSDSTTDADGDGLFNAVDENSGFDVNDEDRDANSIALLDTDGDLNTDGTNAVPLATDSDFRRYRQ